MKKRRKEVLSICDRSFTCSFLEAYRNEGGEGNKVTALVPDRAGSRSCLPFTMCVTVSKTFNL